MNNVVGNFLEMAINRMKNIYIEPANPLAKRILLSHYRQTKYLNIFILKVKLEYSLHKNNL